MSRSNAVSRSDVVLAYRELLGREPESEEIIARYLTFKHVSQIREVIGKSVEYKLRAGLFQEVKAASVEALKIEPPVTVKTTGFKNLWNGLAGFWAGREKSAGVQNTLGPFSAPPEKKSTKASRALIPTVPVQPHRVVFVGNCQVNMLAAMCNAMQQQVVAMGLEMTPRFFSQLEASRFDDVLWADAQCIWVHPNQRWLNWLRKQPEHFQDKVRPLPTIDTLGFHPDCAYVDAKGQSIDSPIGAYHSVLVLWGFLQSLSPQDTRSLFNAQVFKHLGYFDLHASGMSHLVNKGRQCQMPMHRWLAAWHEEGVWMHTINHPKPRVLAQVALHCLAQLGIAGVAEARDVVDDELARSPCWPVYPEVAQALGLRTPGSYAFKCGHRSADQGHGVKYMGLDAFIEASYAVYARHAPSDLQCERLLAQAFQGLPDFLALQAAAPEGHAAQWAGSSNPYRGLPDHQFWRRSVEQVAPPDLDPVLAAPFRIAPTDKVATAGSCFAQHIARTLVAHGFHYLVTEQAPDLPPEAQQARHYGMFSARFGNVYTARQLRQLLEMALGVAPSPQGLVWPREDGRWVDGLRPYIEPDGFDDEAQALASRQQMLACTSDMFQGCDVLVFTLGLTEAWHRTADGVVLPLAPGVASWFAPMDEFAFVNFSHEQVLADMRAFLWLLKSVNPKVRVVLTVSPVPLVATYEQRSVMASTAYSKAVLRTVAQELVNEFAWVAYFASYEVITAAPNAGKYFAADWRNVTPEGVAHVMGLFMKHFASGGNDSLHTQVVQAFGLQQTDLDTATRSVGAVICDEQRLDADLA
jgi:hypothetical protein